MFVDFRFFVYDVGRSFLFSCYISCFFSLYGYIVYDFDNENNELKIKDKYDGKNFNDIQKRNNGCTKCRFNSNNKMKEDKYLIAISKLYNMSIDDILSYY